MEIAVRNAGRGEPVSGTVGVKGWVLLNSWIGGTGGQGEMLASYSACRKRGRSGGRDGQQLFLRWRVFQRECGPSLDLGRISVISHPLLIQNMRSSSCPRSSSKNRIRPRFIHTTICALGAALCLTPSASVADVLSQYNFGPSGTSILTPTAQSPNVTAGTITNGAGITLDLTNSQANPLPTAPWLRVVVPSSTTPAAAVTNNAYFQFSLSANAGFFLNMASLMFDIARGGAGTPRGYEVRTSIDNYA